MLVGKSSYTKEQQAAWKQRHYAENKSAYFQDAQRYHAARRDLIDTIKSVPCMDCLVQYPPEVMEFDHVRGDKLFNISSHIMRSLVVVMTEIEKCDIVCANCHRLRTIKRRSSS